MLLPVYVFNSLQMPDNKRVTTRSRPATSKDKAEFATGLLIGNYQSSIIGHKLTCGILTFHLHHIHVYESLLLCRDNRGADSLSNEERNV